MKIKLILYIFLCLLGFNLNSYADEVFFDSKNLRIEEEGNMIFATKGLAKIPSKSIEIEGDKFIYNKLISELVDRAGGKEGGIVSPKGKAGSMIVFHSCLVHASSNNLSPFNRISVYLSLCAVSNHIRRHKRKEYIAHRDFTPIECLPDDCLIKDYQVDLPWEKGVPEAAYQTSLDEISK